MLGNWPAMGLEQVAAWTGGRLVGATQSVPLGGVSTDSRRISTGNLFVALRGDRFDAHEFLAEVAQLGAGGAVVRADAEAQWLPLAKVLPLVVVPDTRLALGAIAAGWRGHFSGPLIGVTGSNGKTTTKDMIASILRAQARADGLDPAAAVLATEGNLNNDIGVPLTLLRLSSAHRYAVIEMGMNHPGEIAYLAGLARPTAAVVTNALRAHLEGVGSVTAVAEEKGQIYVHLAASGMAVVSAASPYAGRWAELAGGRVVQRFALRDEAPSGADLKVLADWHPEGTGVRLNFSEPGGGSASCFLQMPGRHNAQNALAAGAVCRAAGVPLAIIAQGLSEFTGVKGRLQFKPGCRGAHLIDDTYNANPDSVRAAIDVLAALSGRRVLVLGDMGETGDQALAYHREVGAYAREVGVDVLYALGTLSREAAAGFGPSARHHAGVESLVAELMPNLGSADTVLVKGSRFMRMERVVDALLARPSEEKKQENPPCC